MFINQGAEPQKPQQSFWLHLYELASQKVTEGWRLESVFALFNWLPNAHPPQSMWAKGVKAFTFHKKTNSSSSQTSQGGKVSISLFFWWTLKLLREGASLLLPQCWNCKNLTTFPKNTFLENSDTYWDQGERRCHVILCQKGEHMFWRGGVDTN